MNREFFLFLQSLFFLRCYPYLTTFILGGGGGGISASGVECVTRGYVGPLMGCWYGNQWLGLSLSENKKKMVMDNGENAMCFLSFLGMDSYYFLGIWILCMCNKYWCELVS